MKAYHPLLKRILEGESDVLDFKKTISNVHKIAKTIVAFANTRGGSILIGVNDNKTLSGIKSEEESYMVQSAAEFFCFPPVPVELVEHEIGKITIVEVIIPNSPEKPHYAQDEQGKKWVYIRVKDKSVLASKEVVAVLKREKFQQPATMQYTHLEQGLLDYLSKHEKITLKGFCELVNISRRRASRILVTMVSMGIIRLHTTEKQDFYTLS
ncbi:MAG: putative DNA binding domain-containing protein [Bacteroidia bacterium]|nr:putative DNA binding domain-containing protein [Bacteroidia bacterium]MDW8346661.1 putative DNA binding domain-containing protein [Bacteroidia bacterium]